MNALNTVRVILIAMTAASSSTAAQMDNTVECDASAGCEHSQTPPILWERISNKDAVGLPIKPIDRSVINHSYEKRGFVQVPLDYAKQTGPQIDIFYRLIPTTDPTPREKPILVIMNGGPGVPASAYRSLAYDYADDENSDSLTALSQHFRLLLVDQRGTGHSTPLDLDNPSLPPAAIARYFDSDEHARDHARVINAVVGKDEPFFILARSYGGHIGIKYLTLDEGFRPPNGMVLSSALLPHSDVLETFVLRREKQRELNLQLKAAVPGIVEKLHQLREHLASLGMSRGTVNFLWAELGSGEHWEQEFAREIDSLLGITKAAEMEASLSTGIQQSVNLLNYVLSSAAVTPGYTDRSVTQETSRRVILDDWMLDENWTLNQIGNDGTWRENFITSVDANPPPATEFPTKAEIRNAFESQQVLFTFGKSDAFLPQDLQINTARTYHVPGHTQYRVFSGGHGAAFSEEGAAVVARWASAQIGDRMTTAEFESLMTTVAKGWGRQDTELALSAFTENAVYTEPPTSQYYKGQDELRTFFDAIRPDSTMIWHNLWFDAAGGIGAGEYSFHNGGRKTAAHGVAVVIIRNQKISVWREYQQRGPIDFNDFHEIEGKDWETTVEDLK